MFGLVELGDKNMALQIEHWDGNGGNKFCCHLISSVMGWFVINYCSDRSVLFVEFSSQSITAIQEVIWPSSDHIPSLYGVGPSFHLNKLIIFGKFELLHGLCDHYHWSDFMKIQEIWMS